MPQTLRPPATWTSRNADHQVIVLLNVGETAFGDQTARPARHLLTTAYCG